MTLLAELCLVVDNREDPGPWLRRALLALESRAEAAGVRTWMVERAVYGAALLGATVAQHHATLGADPLPEVLAQVAGLSVSLVALLVGAELDSIAARERDQAEAEGREPVRVECSPRAAQLRTLLPWLGLAGLALAFGWLGALGFAWRLAYPAWRRWYRSHRPLGRVQWIRQAPKQCGQTCVAMLTGQSVAEVCELMGRTTECGELGMRIALQAAGQDLDPALRPGLPEPTKRALVLLRHELTGAGHWVVWDRGQAVCPGEGPLTVRQADEHWWRHYWEVAGHHRVLPEVADPVSSATVDAYRSHGGAR
ncbi:hypothetical protein [Myxococcus sp. Y35]|uniref:hypothetical protein n=1 Tax=Pseudomyxococcus flavus TaxID=3115648 RepID=UPI003CEFDD44